MRFLLMLLTVIVFHTVSISQQNNDVYIAQSFGARNQVCRVSNSVVDKETYRKLLADNDCANTLMPREIDFEEFTFITYRMRGDCFISGSAHVTVDHGMNKYTVHLSNYWGKCRAGGSFTGWLLLERIPDGYVVDFEETKHESSNTSLLTPTLQPGVWGGDEYNSRTDVRSEQTDINGCIQLGIRDEMFISSESQYLLAIRRDARFESCRELATILGFEKFGYIGVNVNSGYCRRPKGLKYRVDEYGGSKKFAVNIAYEDPGNAVCRALSSYDLWLQVPKRPVDYSFVVRISPVVPFNGTLK